MGQLIHQHHGRLARDDGVQIHLVDLDATVHDLPARDHLQPLQQAFRLLPAVGLHQADRDIDAVFLEPLAFQQHLVGLAHPGAVAQVDLELPTL